MNLKRWIAVVLVVSIVGWVGYEAIRDSDDGRLRDLKRSKGDRERAEIDEDAPKKPPSDMVVNLTPGKVWFVGKYEDGGGIEIPFRPGDRPKKSDDQTLVHENPGFVGPEACQQCHKEKYHSFLSTAHYKTSRPVSKESMDGKFEPGTNVMKTSEPGMSFEMVQRGDEFLQRVHFFDWSFEVPMEVVMGSSKMGQTYLYWHKDALFQHNVTHLTAGDQWINSPGYIDGDAAYARPIPQRCLECHMTYFDFRAERNHFTPGSLIMGVTCERCHGPGQEHVNHHLEQTDSRKAFAITNPAKLSRDVQMDVCGQCHGGSRNLKGDALEFRPGDRLDDHYHPADDEAEKKNSVHTSNQRNRLSQSVCFQKTQMTCIDCHDPHHNERGNRSLFSKRCMTCHEQESDCGYFPRDGVDFAGNCVDCHMPQRPTENLRLRSVDGDVFPPLRDHFIRVDEVATKKVMEQLRAKK